MPMIMTRRVCAVGTARRFQYVAPTVFGMISVTTRTASVRPPDGVRDRVQREDRRDRLVELFLSLVEPVTGPLAAILQDGDVRVGDRKEDRFQDRAQERDRERDRDDRQKRNHWLEVSGGGRALATAPPRS
jgi:hypothetical protein